MVTTPVVTTPTKSLSALPPATPAPAAATDLPLHALNKLPYGKLAGGKIGVTEGVMFLTYSSLIASAGV